MDILYAILWLLAVAVLTPLIAIPIALWWQFVFKLSYKWYSQIQKKYKKAE